MIGAETNPMNSSVKRRLYSESLLFHAGVGFSYTFEARCNIREHNRPSAKFLAPEFKIVPVLFRLRIAVGSNVWCDAEEI